MKKVLRRIRFLFTFPRSVPFLKDFFIAEDIAAAKKLLFAGFIIGYFLLPFDLIPDFLLGFGLLDDVTVAIFLLQWMVKMAPQSLKEKYSF